MKKHVSIFIFTVLCFLHSQAQAPNAIPYQGVARNMSGNIIASQSISLRLSIRDVSSAGTVVYSEVHNVITTSLGLFNVNIGQGSNQTGTLAAVNWGSAAKYIQVELDPAGGTSYTNMGTTQLMSVPYALYAQNSNTPGPAGPVGPVGPTGATGPVGPAGPAGPLGPVGPAGATGPTGPVGPVGATGPVGPVGATGPIGPVGPAGPAGPLGPVGPAGATGPAGPAGPVGSQGTQGDPGPVGPDGATGPTGVPGPVGPTGPIGPAGATGPAGVAGPAGPAGVPGPQGLQGPIGIQGIQGIPGPAGPTGPMGATGPAGSTGPAGPTGPTGATGSAGPGVPTGGTANQVLAKVNSTDYNTTWVTPSGGGSHVDLIAIKSTNQLLPVGGPSVTPDDVSFTNVLTSPTLPGASYNGTTYTVGVTGFYLITANAVMVPSTTTSVGLEILVNGNTIAYGAVAQSANFTSAGSARGTASVVVGLIAGNQVKIKAQNTSSSTAKDLAGGPDSPTRWSIVKL